MRKFLKFFIVLLILVSSLQASSEIKSRDEVVSAYIYLLSKNTTWPNEDDKKDFHITIVERGDNLYTTFQEITHDIKLKNKKIILTHLTSIDEIDNLQTNVIFLDNDFRDDAKEVKTKIGNKPILFITENTSDIKDSMIDLYENIKYKINIKINLDFIERNQLEVNEKIILSGGSIVSINKLYHSSIETIKNQEKKFRRYQALNKKLKAQLDSYEQRISYLQKEIQDKKDEYKETVKLIQEKERIISTEEIKILQKEQKLLKMKKNFRNLQKQMRKQKSILDKKIQKIEEQTKNIQKQIEEIEQRKAQISKLDRKIKRQEEAIKTNIKIRNQQAHKIEKQKTSIYLAIAISILLLVFAIYFYKNERRYEKLNEKLIVAKDAAVYANKSKSIFLANMSHELRTPLNAILGFSELLIEDDEISKEHKKTIKIINSSGSFLLSLINDILDISSIEARKIAVAENTINVKLILDEITSLMTNRAEVKSLKLLNEINPDIKECIKLDDKKLRQILLNFITNAIKYSDSGTITTHIDMDEAFLYIKVSDEGIGISEENKKYIFEPFRQVGEASSSTGTGLGLTITKQFVKVMGGDIWVESELNKGSVFGVKLPYKKCLPNENVQIIDSTISKQVIGLSKHSKKLKVLVAEDKKNNILLLESILSVLNFERKFVTDGQKAIEAFMEFEPDIIFMDKRMPNMDGITATKEIRKLPKSKDTIIIIVTANTFATENLKEYGFNDAIIKPYKPKIIYNMMKRYFNLKYIYKEHDLKDNNTDIEISNIKLKEKLEQLENELLEKLFKSAILLNQEDMKEIMQIIANKDEELYNMLNELVENINFTKIIDTINEIKDER